MSAWLSSTLSAHSPQFPDFTAGISARLRALQAGAAKLAHPQTLRRAREQALRVITVVAGH